MENKATELNANIRRTIEQLANETDAARQSQLFRDYLRTSSAFWDYSWHNQMLIWRQKPDASYVAGFNNWLRLGRYVRKGEKGIAILAPMFFKDKRQSPQGTETETQRIWFKVVYVFDLSQTDGTSLPELPSKSVGERQRELEAEATAYVVGAYFGIQSPSDFYLASYKVTPAMLLEAVETIAGTVKTILNGCQDLGHACAA